MTSTERMFDRVNSMIETTGRAALAFSIVLFGMIMAVAITATLPTIMAVIITISTVGMIVSTSAWGFYSWRAEQIAKILS